MNMSATIKVTSLLVQCLYLLTPGTCSDHESDKGGCPLWHVLRNGQCECGASINGIISCVKSFMYIKHGNCLTWNNSTNSTELHNCPWNPNNTCTKYNIPNTYRIPIDITGSKLTCEVYNRKGTHHDIYSLYRYSSCTRS